MKRVLDREIACALTLSILFAAASLRGQEKGPAKIKASAIQVKMIESDEIKLPAEFQVALYEDLIQRLQTKSGFKQVYREGDRTAANAADLVILRSTVRGFKEGSERIRQVTTVAGSTSINVHCEFADRTGRVLLERDINGKVRFFGENLRATYDFAKKTAQLAHDNFSPTPSS